MTIKSLYLIKSVYPQIDEQKRDNLPKPLVKYPKLLRKLNVYYSITFV